MPSSRQQLCETVSGTLAKAAAGLAATRAVVGLDGFVDDIIAVVDKRYADGRYDPIRTIGDFGRKISEAAGQSSNYELVVKQQKLGGNGPIMANALAHLGLGVTYIGNLGHPTLHPAFAGLATRAKVLSIAEPGHTDALECDEGKLMVGKHETLGDVSWENLVARIGLDELIRLWDGATLIGMVNWTMLQRMTDIWERLLAEVVPALGGAKRTLFVDLADPEKRTPEDLRAALGLLVRFQERVDVILGLNHKEALQVASVLGLPSHPDPEAAIAENAGRIRGALGVGCVVIHPRGRAAAATEGEAAELAGPFVRQPRISTGAGDHFNAGFCVGRILGLGLEESLCAGVACSGFYVRTAKSPSAEELAAFIAELPAPEA